MNKLLSNIILYFINDVHVAYEFLLCYVLLIKKILTQIEAFSLQICLKKERKHL